MEISGKTRLFGLIGSPVEHSKSPAMYNYCFDKWKLDYKYLAFDVDKNQTADAIQAFRTFQMKGANITMPCKQEVLKYLDEISPAARLVGACNTIVNHDGLLTGYITDGEGYMKYAGNELEYTLSDLSVHISNNAIASGRSEGYLATATLHLEIPTRFAGRVLPPVSLNLQVQAKYIPKF